MLLDTYYINNPETFSNTTKITPENFITDFITLIYSHQLWTSELNRLEQWNALLQKML
jgi:hypothetical protein